MSFISLCTRGEIFPVESRKRLPHSKTLRELPADSRFSVHDNSRCPTPVLADVSGDDMNRIRKKGVEVGCYWANPA